MVSIARFLTTRSVASGCVCLQLPTVRKPRRYRPVARYTQELTMSRYIVITTWKTIYCGSYKECEIL